MTQDENDCKIIVDPQCHLVDTMGRPVVDMCQISNDQLINAIATIAVLGEKLIEELNRREKTGQEGIGGGTNGTK